MTTTFSGKDMTTILTTHFEILNDIVRHSTISSGNRRYNFWNSVESENANVRTPSLSAISKSNSISKKHLIRRLGAFLFDFFYF